jgi:predicted metal-binding membrane protein
MMLPSSLPLVASLRRVSGGRADGTRPALLLAGYLAAWLLFGIAVNLADLALHRFATAGTFLERHPWLASSLVLALAGSYQLSPMKRRVLAQFHSPHCFLDAHWDGNAPPRRAVWLGLRYGRLCVGCCWPLMLLLFAVGHGSILLMSLLGAVMAVEKHTAWGRELRTPLGIALLAASAALVLV